MKILISGGAKAFRKYVLDVRRNNNLKGAHRKLVRKRNKQTGEILWEKYYYYQKIERTDQEKLEKIQKGHLPGSAHTKYYDKYLGAEAPQGYAEDFLSELLENGKVELDKDDLITDEETLNIIIQRAPHYFLELRTHKLAE